MSSCVFGFLVLLFLLPLFPLSSMEALSSSLFNPKIPDTYFVIRSPPSIRTVNSQTELLKFSRQSQFVRLCVSALAHEVPGDAEDGKTVINDFNILSRESRSLSEVLFSPTKSALCIYFCLEVRNFLLHAVSSLVCLITELVIIRMPAKFPILIFQLVFKCFWLTKGLLDVTPE